MSKLPNYAQVSGFVKSSGGSRVASRVLLGASLLSGLLGVFSYVESFNAQKEIAGANMAMKSVDDARRAQKEERIEGFRQGMDVLKMQAQMAKQPQKPSAKAKK